jgi:hypothetical protein
MTTHLDGLAAVAAVLTDHPVPPGATVTVDLRHYAHAPGQPTVALSLHETPRALTDALTGALGLTPTGSRVVWPQGYRETTYGLRGAHFGPHLSRQGWRTASRGDVARCTA